MTTLLRDGYGFPEHSRNVTFALETNGMEVRETTQKSDAILYTLFFVISVHVPLPPAVWLLSLFSSGDCVRACPGKSRAAGTGVMQDTRYYNALVEKTGDLHLGTVGRTPSRSYTARDKGGCGRSGGGAGIPWYLKNRTSQM